MNRNGMGMGMNANRKLISKIVSSVFAMLAVVLLLTAGARPALGQTNICPGQNWTTSTPNVWAAEGSIKVLLNNQATTNQPTIPTYQYDGNFNPWGYQQHPQSITQLNPVYSCPGGTPTISIAGAGRETVSFQVFITAGLGTSAALTGVSVGVNFTSGPGTPPTSGTTQTSDVTRYLEGYVPSSGNGVPDALVPFYDPYDSGNPAVGASFNVQPGTTQGVWVDVAIPAGQAAGTYAGNVTVTGNGVSATIPINLTVWNGTLPRFDSGSVNSAHADMLKTWMAAYTGRFLSGEGVAGGSTAEQTLFQKYQVMAHAYDFDTFYDIVGPGISGAYTAPGAAGPTSFTTGPPTGPGATGTTSTINWTSYDAFNGPALTPGGLFADGTSMRVFDTPFVGGQGNNSWVYGYCWNYYPSGNCPAGTTPPPPAGLLQLYANYSEQISQHFTYNQANKGWGHPELIAYTYDEPYAAGGIADTDEIYRDIAMFEQAMNQANTALSPTWAANTNPIRSFLTDFPACERTEDTSGSTSVGNNSYDNTACADHINLSYPGGPNADIDPNTGSAYTSSWVMDWSPDGPVYFPGQPGPGLSYASAANPASLIAGTGYEYTLDMAQGVPAKSTAPLPIEKWTYQAGDPFAASDSWGGGSDVGVRVNFWIAYKYGLDVTTPSVGDPSPTAPAPGGVWDWADDFWGGAPGSCSDSPYMDGSINNGFGGGGFFFYPGNQLTCFNATGALGASVLTQSLAYNGSNGISGPVASIRMEQWRRGYEDYEYLYLLGQKNGRSAALAVVDSMGGGGMASWNALDWDNIQPYWYTPGVPGSNGCAGTTNLPNGPTGDFHCPGEWTNNPDRYAAARVALATHLGWDTASAAVPTITSLNPASGSNLGGTTVIISGTNLSGVTEVQFGGVDATSFSYNSSNGTLSAVTPAALNANVQGVDVQVFAPSGDSVPSSASQYTYLSPVTVTGVSPAQGVAAGGNTVTISGTYFASGATVHFGPNLATNVVVNSANSLTATAPAGSGTVNITVTTPQGTSAINSSDQYTYEPPPTVSSVTPNTGSITGGTSVTVAGSGFVSGGTTVTFGGVAATGVNVTSTTSLTATSPAGSANGTVAVVVTTSFGSSAINNGDRFTYTSPVTVTGLSVHSGPAAGGTSVVITGTDFSSGAMVHFGSNTVASTFQSATQITAVSPAGGGVVDVTVTASGYTSAANPSTDQFSYGSMVAGGTYATFPTTAVGSTSTTQTVSVTLTASGTISSITVPPTQNGKHEFTVGSWSCTTSTCTVPVTFSPQYPGVRMGALTISDSGGVVGTAGLAGIGTGPEVAQSPGALTIYAGGGPTGVTATPEPATSAAISTQSNGDVLAVDGAGNIYIADSNGGNGNGNCLAYKVSAATDKIVVIAGNYTFASGAVTPSTTPEPALGSNTCPQGIAADSAGNVYIVDSNNVNAVEEVSAATGQIQVIAGGGTTTPSTTAEPALNAKLNGVNSLATDKAGNLYISDFYDNLVEQVNPAGQIVVVAGGGSTAPSATAVAATSAALSGPTGMVVDDAGNLYISDQNVNQVDKVTAGNITLVAGGGGTHPTTTLVLATSASLNAPGELAVDGSGDLYLADVCNNLVEEVTGLTTSSPQLAVVAGGGGTAPSATPQLPTSASFGNIQGVTMDGVGNLYVADSGNNVVSKVNTQAMPLNFGYVTANTTSAPQTITLSNIGNAALSLASLSAAADFPLQTTGTTCTVVSSPPQSLAAGGSCNLAYAFQAPSANGAYSGSDTLTDNTLNVTGSTQLISFTGTTTGGTSAPPAATPTFSPAGGTYSSAQTVTISDATSGATIYYTTNGTTPTTSSPVYSGPITVSSTETIEAIATASGYSQSAVGSAAYTITVAGATYTVTDLTDSATDTGSIRYAVNQVNAGTGGATIDFSGAGASGTITLTNGTLTLSQNVTITGPGANLLTISGNNAVTVFAVSSGVTASISGLTIANGSNTNNISNGGGGGIINNGTLTVSNSTLSGNSTAPSGNYAVGGGIANGTGTLTVSNSTFSGNAANGQNGNWGYGGGIANNHGGTVIVSNSTFTGNSASSGNSSYGGAIFNGSGGMVKVNNVTVSGNTVYTAGGGIVNNGTTLTITNSIVAGNTTTGNPGDDCDSCGTQSSNNLISTPSNIINPMLGSLAYNGGPTETMLPLTGSPALGAGLSSTLPTDQRGDPRPTGTGVVSDLGSVEVTQGSAQAATPTFSPAGGTYSSAQTVTISDATSGATIYYTTNGTTPTTSSSVYSGAITVSSTETVEAIATASGYTTSAVGSAAYTINLPAAATPTFSPAGGTYSSAQTVTISDATSGATIYYTTNGTTPTTSSSVYSGAITVSSTETVEAIATASGYTTSAVGSAAYTINLPAAATPTFSPAGGTYSSAQTVTISDATSGATIYYTTNGTTPTTSSPVYSGPITVSSTETIEAIATASGYSQSAVGSAAYTISTTAPVVTGLTITSGPTWGSTYMAINGSGFTGATAVKFGSNYATIDGGGTATTIYVDSPPAPGGTAGVVNVTVTTPSGTSATTSADQFTYYYGATVTGVTPNSGPAGTSVTITGTGFTQCGGFIPQFGGITASSYTINSATQITAVSPSGSGTVDVTVYQGNCSDYRSPTSSADQYTY